MSLSVQLGGQSGGQSKLHLVNTLALIAPESFMPLAVSLKALFTKVIFINRPEPSGGTPDPYELRTLIKQMKPRPGGILLIAPRRRAPGRLIPAPVIESTPIGIVQADKPEHLQPWLQAILDTHRQSVQPIWAALAMNKSFYLNWGRQWAEWMGAVEKASGLGTGNSPVKAQSWLADIVPRETLCLSLAKGPSLAVYCGHGRARGWSGYRALRWEHITSVKQEKPCGTIIGLACDTLKRSRGLTPFGCQWINEGRACAYLGSVARLGIKANDAFARVMGEILKEGKCRTIGQLLYAVDRHLQKNPDLIDARKGFNTYRLMGNPLQRLY